MSTEIQESTGVLLNEKQVAQKLGVSVALVRKLRRQRTGPAFVRIGRLIRYKDLASYIDGCCAEPKQ